MRRGGSIDRLDRARARRRRLLPVGRRTARDSTRFLPDTGLSLRRPERASGPPRKEMPAHARMTAAFLFDRAALAFPWRRVRAREGSAAGRLKRHAPLDDRAVLLELVHRPVQTRGVHSQLLGDLARVMPGRCLTRRRTSCCRRDVRLEPARLSLAELCGERARRACVAATDALVVPPSALPSCLDAADRAAVFAARRRGRAGLVEAGGRVPGAGASSLTLNPRRWATCSSSWYSATSGMSSRRRLATCSSAVRN